MSSSQMPESALAEFFAEADEILQRFSSGLTQIEKEGHRPETIDSLYRDMHTLKGTAHLFGFASIGQTAHAIEACLEPIRRLKIQIPSDLVDVIFKCVDLLDRMLKVASEKKADSTLDVEMKERVPLLVDAATRIFGGDYKLVRDTWSVSEGLELPHQAEPRVEKKTEQKSEQKIEQKIEIQKKAEAVAGAAITPPPQSKPQEVPPKMENPAKEDPTASSEATSTVRIQVSLLDRLMNLVGEMVLVRNQVLQYTQKHDEFEFLNMSQRLDIVTSELQGEVMKTRMQPIGTILSKFQRVVRDLARDMGKQIEMNVQGAETELDKTLLEAIKDPLTHIIRNSCDHGIESSDDRRAAGKNPMGHVLVRAFHEGGQVIVEIIDDGRGLNYKRIREKAVEKKLISAERAQGMSERDVGLLIFAPGFSTAENVSAVSGRGVGMDVVKTNLEKVGGVIEINSVQGKGMTIRMRIPLTLAIVPALLVRSGNDHFAIPQVKLAELVRVENEGPGPKIEYLQGNPVFRLRGDLLPLLDLNAMLGLKVASTKPDSVNIVVLNSEGETFGLIVDEIRDTADIVVKPLPQFLKRLMSYSGATIMGDGSVALILDISGIAMRAHLQKPSSSKNGFDGVGLSEVKKAASDAQDFLFFGLNSKEQYCMPLCLLNRLEEFKASDVEHSGNLRVVQYRDSILPIVSLNEFLKLQNPTGAVVDKESPVSVIVVPKKGKLYGIEVNSVEDIMNVDHAIEDPVREQKGILGSVIVEKGVATVVDILGVLDELTGGNRGSASEAVTDKSSRAFKGLKVLFAEDTVFFIKQVKKVLESQGMIVTHAPDGEEAFKILQTAKAGDFDFVLSDIEMPKMTGFELCEKIRSDQTWSKLPVIALTTRFREVDIERGAMVGFTRYLEKLKPDVLLENVSQILKEKQ